MKKPKHLPDFPFIECFDDSPAFFVFLKFKNLFLLRLTATGSNQSLATQIVRVLRVLRVLRPLKAIQRVKKLKVIP